jgi:ferredoxin-NADP reductase
VYECALKEEVTVTTVLRPARTAFRSPLALLQALATPHGVDRYLELVNPALTVRELRAKITDVRQATPESLAITLRPTRQWQGFVAGQFVELALDIDGVRQRRCYSPCSSQYRDDGQFELTIKAHPNGLVSQHLYAAAQVGTVVGLSQAQGGFCLPDARPERVVLISGGSGITPVLAMLRTLCDEDYRGEVVFVHYTTGQHTLVHAGELARLAAKHSNVRIVRAFTGTTAGDLSGRFTPAHLHAVAPWFAGAQTYLCGPPGLMDSVRQCYSAVGAVSRLHTEEFTAPVSRARTGEAEGAVSFTESRITAPNDGSSLLQQAEAAGLTPAYGCRMGICFTCTTVKTNGCTRNLLTGELETDPDTEIQLCISAPVGDVAIAL